ncbi:hypothetical protein NAI52_12670, partial [Francisella tularensis subsp. holarctica]|uniref:hypothetical protein n=1 Tax=Francisella tularensis TaxID=263 RepID=UPI002381AFF6
PKVQNSSFDSSNFTAKQKVLLMPACTNRIFAGNRKYPKYPSQLIIEMLGFEVNSPANLNSQCCGQKYHSQSNYIQQQ